MPNIEHGEVQHQVTAETHVVTADGALDLAVEVQRRLADPKITKSADTPLFDALWDVLGICPAAFQHSPGVGEAVHLNYMASDRGLNLATFPDEIVENANLVEATYGRYDRARMKDREDRARDADNARREYNAR